MSGLERIFFEVLSNPACNETFESLDNAGLDVVLQYFEMFQVKAAYETAIDLEKNAQNEAAMKKYNRK